MRDDITDLGMAWRFTIFGLVLANCTVSTLFELVVSPYAVQQYKAYKRRTTVLGFVYNRRKPIVGKRAKLYHQLRGAFEKSWDVLALNGNDKDEHSAL